MTRVVTLSASDLAWATSVGVKRNRGAQNLEEKHGQNRDPLAVHIQGAKGELATARAAGIAWPAHIGTYRRVPDLGPLPGRETRGTEVKTRSLPEYELIVRHDDVTFNVDFVLVTGTTGPAFNVVGYIEGEKAKNPAWLHRHGGREEAFFVPHSALLPIPTRRPL